MKALVKYEKGPGNLEIREVKEPEVKEEPVAEPVIVPEPKMEPVQEVIIEKTEIVTEQSEPPHNPSLRKSKVFS